MTRTGQGHCNVMGHRIIAGLQTASTCGKPSNIPLVSRLRGTKRLGLKYEKDFGKALAARYPRNCIAGQWFRFIDANGHGYCQPDLLVKKPDEVILFECKLTDTEKGRSQLARLYFPVVQHVFGLPVRGVVVTRHLSKETEIALVTDLLDTAISSPRDVIPTLHWRERTPL